MLVPTRGRLIVKNIPDTKMTASGLYLAETIKEVPHRGEVIAIGNKYRDLSGKEFDWHFSVGEIVHYKRQWNSIKADLYILKREEIYAVESTGGGFRAVMDQVIVKRVYTGKIGTSTIVIPEGMGIESNMIDFYGIVVAEGPESRFNFKHGDKILYSRNEGLSFKYEEQEYFSLKPRAILGLED